VKKISTIATRHWHDSQGQEEPLLFEKEVNMLSIPRGTLSEQERHVINNHVSVTLKMLQALPYPKNLKNVPDLAGSHHERVDGKGYPRNLTKDQMSLPARMIAIADVFEALTASDRPYKKSMSLSQALNIMGRMKLDGHIDPDLFDVFTNMKVYEKYAEQYLNQSALDSLDLKSIPGYVKLA
jgi:HD-GYP domain-containing protein (c-di-GMP phosphodiesterase class II)